MRQPSSPNRGQNRTDLISNPTPLLHPRELQMPWPCVCLPKRTRHVQKTLCLLLLMSEADSLISSSNNCADWSKGMWSGFLSHSRPTLCVKSYQGHLIPSSHRTPPDASYGFVNVCESIKVNNLNSWYLRDFILPVKTVALVPQQISLRQVACFLSRNISISWLNITRLDS